MDPIKNDVLNTRGVYKTIIDSEKEKYESISIDIILENNTILRDIVKKDEIIEINTEEYKKRIKNNGESIRNTINRLVLREFEISYIILNSEISIKNNNEKLNKIETKIIYSKHENGRG